MSSRVRRLRVVDVSVELAWDAPGLQAVGTALYADAPPEGSAVATGAAARAAPVGADLKMSLSGRPGAWTVTTADGAHAAGRVRCTCLSELYQTAEVEITEAALARLSQRFLLLHAGAVAFDDAALLVAGAHDAGKSSLVAACARAGAALFGDDIAPVAPEGLRVHPFPRDLVLHAGTRRALPGLPPSPGFQCFPGYRYLPPGALGRPARRPLRAGAILFPRRTPGAAVRLQPLGPAEVARRLLSQCFDLRGLGGASVTAAAAELAALPAAELVYADATPAAAAVEAWWRRSR